MNNTRESTFDDVFSVIAWSIVYPWGNGNTFYLLHFMMGGRLIRNDTLKAIVFCRKELFLQFPKLATRSMTKLLASMEDDVSKAEDKEAKKLVITFWINLFRWHHQDTFLVRPFGDAEVPFLD
jgi:hypothetical protein